MKEYNKSKAIKIFIGLKLLEISAALLVIGLISFGPYYWGIHLITRPICAGDIYSFT
mgnify:CR=1 FL=1